MRGAAFLSRNQDAIVVDIGGTTTDVGVLVNGFPRPASFRVKCAGVMTNFRMPDVFSCALGGGSIVSNEGKEVLRPRLHYTGLLFIPV
jgi:N-methylhydantoinase A/oxoprolinase/acetone carboxylase beta subunit